MSRTTLSRRTFLKGLGATALCGSHLGWLACGDNLKRGTAPTRLLIIHKPCGTVPKNYDCEGEGSDFTLSPILSPLEEFRSQLVILDGLDIRKPKVTPGQDHGNGMVTFMTGGSAILADGFRAVIADRESIDHLLSRNAAIVGGSPVRSIQLAADIRSDRNEVFTRVLSYSGKAAPLPPEQRPSAAFARVFGGLMDGGPTEANRAALEHARARRKSVLDFSRDGLERLNSHVGSDSRHRLESHLEAIRELERGLDRGFSCDPATELAPLVQSIDGNSLDALHGEIGLAHLNVIRTAFQCDISRLATFGWATGNSHVNFSSLIPGVENLGHHAITHQGANRAADETAIHRWYNERLADFLRMMGQTPDVDGRTLLDNTLIVVFSEIRLGKHTFENVPIQLLGGASGRLEGNRLLRFGGHSTNDLWVAIANALGHPMDTFGDPSLSDGPLPNVFS